MPDQPEAHNQGMDQEAAEGAGLRLGHSIYARHVGFHGIDSIGSFAAGRIARYSIGGATLSRNMQGPWKIGPGAWSSWPSMEWLQTYRGNRAPALRRVGQVSRSSAVQGTVLPDEYWNHLEPQGPHAETAANAAQSDSPSAASGRTIAGHRTALNPPQPNLQSVQGELNTVSPLRDVAASAPSANSSPASRNSVSSESLSGENRSADSAAGHEVHHASQSETAQANRFAETPTVRAELKPEYGEAVAFQHMSQLPPSRAIQARLRANTSTYTEHPILQRPVLGKSETMLNVSASRNGATPPDSAVPHADALVSSSVPLLSPGSMATPKTVVHRQGEAPITSVQATSPHHASLSADSASSGSRAVASGSRVNAAETKTAQTAQKVSQAMRPLQAELRREASGRDTPAVTPGKQVAAALAPVAFAKSLPERVIHRAEQSHPAQRKPVAQPASSSGVADGKPAVQRLEPVDADLPIKNDNRHASVLNPGGTDGRSSALPAGSSPIFKASEGLPPNVSPTLRSNVAMPLVFRALSLSGSAASLTSPAHSYSSHVLQRYEESLITRLHRLGATGSSQRPVVQPVSVSPSAQLDFRAVNTESASESAAGVRHEVHRSTDVSAPASKRMEDAVRPMSTTDSASVLSGSDPANLADKVLVQPHAQIHHAPASVPSDKDASLVTVQEEETSGSVHPPLHAAHTAPVITTDSTNGFAGSGPTNLADKVFAQPHAQTQRSPASVRRVSDSVLADHGASLLTVREEEASGSVHGPPNPAHRAPESVVSPLNPTHRTPEIAQAFTPSATAPSAKAHSEHPHAAQPFGTANSPLTASTIAPVIARAPNSVARRNLTDAQSHDAATQPVDLAGQTPFQIVRPDGVTWQPPLMIASHASEPALPGAEYVARSVDSRVAGLDRTTPADVSESPERLSPVVTSAFAGQETAGREAVAMRRPSDASLMFSGASHSVHLSPLASGRGGTWLSRQPEANQLRTPSPTHRVSRAAEATSRTSQTGLIGPSAIMRQIDGSAPAGTVSATVPMPSASSFGGLGTGAQSHQNVDVGQLANRVYELLVRRLASERQRRGL